MLEMGDMVITAAIPDIQMSGDRSMASCNDVNMSHARIYRHETAHSLLERSGDVPLLHPHLHIAHVQLMLHAPAQGGNEMTRSEMKLTGAVMQECKSATAID